MVKQIVQKSDSFLRFIAKLENNNGRWPINGQQWKLVGLNKTAIDSCNCNVLSSIVKQYHCSVHLVFDEEIDNYP